MALKQYNSILPAENTGGEETKVRLESPKGGESNMKIIKVVLDGTALTADANILIGDPDDLILNKGYGESEESALVKGLVIGGSFGANTLQQLKKYARYNLRFHGLTGIAGGASANTYFDNGVRTTALEANVLASVRDTPVEYSFFRKGDQYEPNVRNLAGFRFTLSPLSAILQNISPGDVVTLHFHARSIGTGAAMELT